MDYRALDRLRHMKDAITQIDLLLNNRTYDEFVADRVFYAAFERFISIVSEASRHLPDQFKRDEPSIPWRRVADIGHQLRHVYHRIDPVVLWNLHSEGMIEEIHSAVDRMIEAAGSDR